MKIIRQGNVVPPKQDMIAECDKCKCIFTFNENESRYTPNNGGGSVYDCKCPNCGFGCYYDTGYSNPESNRTVMDTHDRLRSYI